MQRSDQADRLPEALDRLSELLLADHTLDATLQQAAQLAVWGIRGADLAGMTVIRDGLVYTGGASEELVEEIDSFQYASGEGPCLAAMAESSVVSLSSTTSDPRWLQFSRKAAAKGIGSVLSSSLTTGTQTIGSLNLYAYKENSFDDRDRETLVVFARHAATLVANANAFDESKSLSFRLHRSQEDCNRIGQATGILMERFHTTEKVADIALRRDSSRQGKQLGQLAEEIVASVGSTDS
jgi:GAF domain-containing protein